MKLHALSAEAAEFNLEHLGFDDCERGLLAVARYFFLARSSPEQQSWQVAFSVSVERWGSDIGLPIAFAMSKLVRSVADVRTDFFSCDPFDDDARGRASFDEAVLMRMLHHMRREQTPDARDAVEVLTRGLMDPHVIRAGLAVAARFGCGAPVRRRLFASHMMQHPHQDRLV
ncbi:MAG: hypothetical protein AAFQ58_23670, partial [Pseudomonadota bacterium]